ncbi:mitogen-activated protein kinase kinase [Phaffia rhodozyma]|uniref:Mitogen-activated protein kinase kinase n=1 Tax=Phaffia rhodozyma TaxID=264483 RepID=A0A0F7SUT3_PHARH|nr:mitogen-activated protein kinase kinase [Phaffia rhodozyma]
MSAPPPRRPGGARPNVSSLGSSLSGRPSLNFLAAEAGSCAGLNGYIDEYPSKPPNHSRPTYPPQSDFALAASHQDNTSLVGRSPGSSSAASSIPSRPTLGISTPSRSELRQDSNDARAQLSDDQNATSTSYPQSTVSEAPCSDQPSASSIASPFKSKLSLSLGATHSSLSPQNRGTLLQTSSSSSFRNQPAQSSPHINFSPPTQSLTTPTVSSMSPSPSASRPRVPILAVVQSGPTSSEEDRTESLPSRSASSVEGRVKSLPRPNLSPSPMSSRPKLGLSLGIPNGNVPGINVDQAGEIGWVDSQGISLVNPNARPAFFSNASPSPSASRPRVPTLATPKPSLSLSLSPSYRSTGRLSSPTSDHLTPTPTSYQESSQPPPKLFLSTTLSPSQSSFVTPVPYSDFDESSSGDRTVRPLSVAELEDGGVYGGYGTPGVLNLQSVSTGWDERTSLPKAGSTLAGSRSTSSMADDLRAAVSGLSLRDPPNLGRTRPHTAEEGWVRSSEESVRSSSSSGSSSGYGSGREVDMAQQDSVTAKQEVVPLRFDPAELEDLAYLGEGAGGAVTKVRNRRTGVVMAKKIIPSSPNPAIHRQILRELQFLSTCSSPCIVDHYGSFLTDGDSMIGILMEYCEGKSLDAVVKESKRKGLRSSERILGKIAVAVLRGLDYLHERRIIHRDIKPSNILVTQQGQFKICDFGVSGELVGSLAGTFTGTSFYMAPERILGREYSIKSDVWSLGLSLLEVASNRFPFPPEGEPPIVGQFDLLNFIVNQPPPKLVDDEDVVWSEGIKDVVRLCLIPSAADRPYPRDLLRHPFVRQSERRKTDLAKWIAHIWDW